MHVYPSHMPISIQVTTPFLYVQRLRSAFHALNSLLRVDQIILQIININLIAPRRNPFVISETSR